MNTEHKTEYTSGVFKLLKFNGTVSYFSAIRTHEGLVFTSPANWVGTLTLDSPDHEDMKLRAAGGTIRKLLAERNPTRSFGATGGFTCVVDEEFIMSYDGVVPEVWPGVGSV